MAACIFCGRNIPRGTGKIYAKTDGKILNFCTMKCEKNMLVLNRKSRTTTWTKEHADIKAGKGSGKKSKQKLGQNKTGGKQ